VRKPTQRLGWILAPAVAWLVTAATPALGAGQEVHSHSVWDRHVNHGLKVDQEQTRTGTVAGNRVGQVFVPQVEWLERLDIIAKNRTDQTPGKIRIWKWRTTPRKSRQTKNGAARTPDWEDDLDFSGQDAPVLKHYYPRIKLAPGKPYYIECVRLSESFYMGGIRQDVYPHGTAWTMDRERKDQDMWFRTFTKDPDAKPVEAMRPLPPMPDTRPKPPRPLKPVTKKTYLDVLIKVARNRGPGWKRPSGKAVHGSLFIVGFLVKATGDKGWARDVSIYLNKGKEYFQANPDFRPTFRYISQFGHGVRWLTEARAIGKADLETAKWILLEVGRRNWELRERGAHNRATFKGLGRDMLLEMYPDDIPAKHKAQWKAFAEIAWKDWADFLDTDEDSAHYNAVWFDAVLPWIELRGKTKEFFSDPRMRRFVDSRRDMLTPQGAAPSFGDSLMLGADWGGYIALFETAAAVTRDGTYKWAAHKVLEQHRRFILDENPLQCAYEDHPNLAWAYLAADDSVKPTPPTWASRVMTTTMMVRNPVAERKAKGLPWATLVDRQTPWKLVTRDGGTDENGMYALWGLKPWGGHGHADAPALICLVADGTVLTHDTSYFDKRVEDHNMFYGIRVSGGKLGKGAEETQVKRFSDIPGLTYADVAWTDYPGWGTAFRREILFVKGLGWWVRDRTDAAEPAEWHLGPIWHVDRVLKRGPNWFDVDYPDPSSFAWKTANGTGHLLVYFTPRKDAAVDHADFRHQVRKDPKGNVKWWYSSLPWAVYQTAGPLKFGGDAGQQHFNSLLMPLKKAQTAAGAVRGIEVVEDSSAATVLKIKRGKTTWTLALQNDGRTRTVGPVKTDAVAVVVREETGKKPAISAVGARTVQIGSRKLHESAEPKDFNQGS